MAHFSKGALALPLLFALIATPAFAQDGAADLGLADPQTPLDFSSQAGGLRHLGTTQVFNNDWIGMPIGDRYDRWRTGSYQVSTVWGRSDWDGVLPSDPLALIEVRFRGEIIAPDNLAAPAKGDRLYAPALYLGASTHFAARGVEVSAGADLVMAGEQTGLMGLHGRIHQSFGGADVELSDYMIDDGTYISARVEAGHTIESGTVSFRPFVEAQAGVETFVRLGADLRLGAYAPDALLLRDPVTGQRVMAATGAGGGDWSFSLGGDLAYVAHSVFLPDDGPAELEALRLRLRGGVNYAFGPADVFYGITYMAEEFTAQDQGQLVGSIALNLRF